MEIPGVLRDIDELKARLLEIRAHFPHFGADSVGKSEFSTAPFYTAAGLTLTLRFARLLTEDDVSRLNGLGHWINQSVLVRFVAILLEHGIFLDGKPHRRDVDDHQHVSIARDLRHVILKEGGHFKPSKEVHRGYMADLGVMYGVAVDPPPDEFPLPIDKVMVPMIDGCRRYVEAWLKVGPPERAGDTT